MIEKFLKNYNWIITVVAIVTIFLFLRQCNSNRSERAQSEQNIAALTEDIKVTKDKLGQVTFEKASLLTSAKDLKEFNDSLNQEVVYWRKKGSQVKTVIQTEVVYNDTGSTKTNVLTLGGGQYRLKFDYNSQDKLAIIEGYNDVLVTALGATATDTRFTKIQLTTPLTIGMKKDPDGITRAYVKTISDKFTVTKLDAAEIEKFYKSKYNKRIAIGPMLGFGIGFSGTNMILAPFVGVGGTYALIRF